MDLFLVTSSFSLSLGYIGPPERIRSQQNEEDFTRPLKLSLCVLPSLLSDGNAIGRSVGRRSVLGSTLLAGVEKEGERGEGE